MVLKHGLTVGGKRLAEHLEVINHQTAIDYVESLATRQEPPSEADILALHAIALRSIDDEHAARTAAGRYTSLVRSMFHRPERPCLAGWKSTSAGWRATGAEIGIGGGLHPVERAAHAHFWLVDIHPFVDGNGRVARLMMNLLLMQSGYPIAIIRNEDRAAYYAALEAGHEGRLQAFLVFVADAVDRTAEIMLSVTDG